jgi:uncharacterized membrane protein
MVHAIAARSLTPYTFSMSNNNQTHKNHHLTSDLSIQCLNDLDAGKISKGHLWAERAVQMIGSWKFIIIQSLVLVVWTIINIVAWFEHWDPYPFILLNLFLALQAAYTGPVIMMTQNRQAARDRLEAHNDYLVNVKAEKEIRALAKQLDELKKMLSEKS